MKKQHRSRGKIISGTVLSVFLICVVMFTVGKRKNSNDIIPEGNKESESQMVSEAESVSSANEKAADNIIPFGEVCHAENTYYGSSSYTQKLDIRVIDVEVTKECREDFDFGYYGKEHIYSEYEFGWNNKYGPYSEIADKDMNMISDFSYVLVTIEVSEKNTEDFELSDDARRCCLAAFNLNHEKITGISIESRANISDDRIDPVHGTVILKTGETYRFTNIYIIKDECIDEKLTLEASPYGNRMYIMDLGIKGEE